MGRQAVPAGLEPGPDIMPLLNASKYCLCHRDYTESLKYGDRAQESNPNHPDPPRIIAISAVLSASPSSVRPESPDWYSILNLPRFTQDPNLIRTRFDSLRSLLNPEQNHYPFAAEARGWVIEAGSVLSNPNEKARFDRELKMGKNDGVTETFWTLCPYCYFMYEYEKAYEECVLRCQNPKCKRAFTAVAVAASAEPPPAVVEKGKYTCYGFTPLGPNKERACDSGEEKGNKWWAPFVSMGSGMDPDPGRANQSEKNDGYIEISDDGMEGEEEVRKRGDGNGVNGEKMGMKRKKVMAKCSKKLMGKGIKVVGNHSLPSEGGEGMGSKGEKNGENANTSGGVMEGCKGVGLELEFRVGDDDIFVALNPLAD
ncbi:hypothetical protein ACH5RR_013285 [Cinchona calisaya]|uniref:J domain-containing protein n=1 Tax=Cinchona calisaya TaxID=153742 RepID=A0ABD3A5B5_9GENT